MNLISTLIGKNDPETEPASAHDENPTDSLCSLAGSLLYALNSQGGNTVISPSCLYQTLSMIAEITDGSTRKQIADALGGIEGMRSVIGSILTMEPPRYGCDNFHYSTGSSLWLSKSLRKGSALSKHAKHLVPIEIETVEMGSNGAAVAMNEWLRANTGGMYFEAPKTRPSDLLVALGAMHLRDSWENDFDEGKAHAFIEDDGGRHIIDFMLGWNRYDILERDGSLTIAKDLSGGSQMIVSLPPQGNTLEEYISNGSAWRNITDYMQGVFSEEFRECKLYMPKFDISSDGLDLRDILVSLGMTDIFQANADFSPLTPDPVAVDSVRQSTRLKIDEQGLEGASYVEVILCLGIPPENPLGPKTIYIDRPFAVTVVSRDGSPLFVGTVKHIDEQGE